MSLDVTRWHAYGVDDRCCVKRDHWDTDRPVCSWMTEYYGPTDPAGNPLRLYSRQAAEDTAARLNAESVTGADIQQAADVASLGIIEGETA